MATVQGAGRQARSTRARCASASESAARASPASFGSALSRSMPRWAACSVVVGKLPDPLPEGGPLAGESGLAGTSTASRGGASSSGGNEPGNAGEPSATAGTLGSSGGNTQNACDADHDKHTAQGVCGGDDCDDTDPDVLPGQ